MIDDTKGIIIHIVRRLQNDMFTVDKFMDLMNIRMIILESYITGLMASSRFIYT